MPRYVTADTLSGIPSLADVPADQYDQVLDDASTVLGYVAENEWADDETLRKAFEQRDWDPDRVNLALGVLRDTGRLHAFSERRDDVLPASEPATSPVDDEPEPA